MRYGNIGLIRARKIFTCQQCENKIYPDDDYIILNSSRMGKENKIYFSQRFHQECILPFLRSRNNLRRQEMLSKVRGNSKKLRALDEQQKHRRETLLKYLAGKDIPDLLTGYRNREAAGVYRAMGNIAKRLVELDSFGVIETYEDTFPKQTITQPEAKLWIYKTLNKYVSTFRAFDGDWLEVFQEASYEERLELLIRPNGLTKPPVWPKESAEELREFNAEYAE